MALCTLLLQVIPGLCSHYFLQGKARTPGIHHCHILSIFLLIAVNPQSRICGLAGHNKRRCQHGEIRPVEVQCGNPAEQLTMPEIKDEE